MQIKRSSNNRRIDSLESKLNAVTNQLLDLGKRNRLLNFKDTGLKSLRLMNKNIEEIFRAVKNYKDISFQSSYNRKYEEVPFQYSFQLHDAEHREALN